jgi:hypothetical protein
MGCAWHAHGSPLRGVVAVQSRGGRPEDGLMVDGPLEDLVFLFQCNLLVFLGWAKIVAIYFMLKYYNICCCMIT